MRNALMKGREMEFESVACGWLAAAHSDGCGGMHTTGFRYWLTCCCFVLGVCRVNRGFFVQRMLRLQQHRGVAKALLVINAPHVMETVNRFNQAVAVQVRCMMVWIFSRINTPNVSQFRRRNVPIDAVISGSEVVVVVAVVHIAVSVAIRRKRTACPARVQLHSQLCAIRFRCFKL